MHDGHDHGGGTPTTPTEFGTHIVEGPNKIPNYAYLPKANGLKYDARIFYTDR